MTIEIDYPFVRTVGQRYGDDRSTGPDDKFLSWRPGVEFNQYMGGMNPDGPEPMERFVANGMGKILLTEIDRHKLPKPFHTRVFYIRQWRDPDGRVFGKRTLRILTAGRFTTLCNGWLKEFEFELVPGAVPDDVVEFEREAVQ